MDNPSGQLLGTACLCLMFGGNLSDVIAAVLVSFILYWALRILALPALDRIITNALCMWLASTLAILLVRLGLGENCSVIIITLSMIVIPGIPLVNAVRNLFCKNEMNGILQLLKVVLETISLAVGTYISVWMFGGLIRW